MHLGVSAVSGYSLRGSVIFSLCSLDSGLEKLLLVTTGQAQQGVTSLHVKFQAVNKLQNYKAHFTLSPSLSLFPDSLSFQFTYGGTYLSIHEQNLHHVMPLWGYFDHVGPQCFLWEQSF